MNFSGCGYIRTERLTWVLVFRTIFLKVFHWTTNPTATAYKNKTPQHECYNSQRWRVNAISLSYPFPFTFVLPLVPRNRVVKTYPYETRRHCVTVTSSYIIASCCYVTRGDKCWSQTLRLKVCVWSQTLRLKVCVWSQTLRLKVCVWSQTLRLKVCVWSQTLRLKVCVWTQTLRLKVCVWSQTLRLKCVFDLKLSV